MNFFFFFFNWGENKQNLIFFKKSNDNFLQLDKTIKFFYSFNKVSIYSLFFPFIFYLFFCSLSLFPIKCFLFPIKCSFETIKKTSPYIFLNNQNISKINKFSLIKNNEDKIRFLRAEEGEKEENVKDKGKNNELKYCFCFSSYGNSGVSSKCSLSPPVSSSFSDKNNNDKKTNNTNNNNAQFDVVDFSKLSSISFPSSNSIAHIIKDGKNQTNVENEQQNFVNKNLLASSQRALHSLYQFYTKDVVKEKAKEKCDKTPKNNITNIFDKEIFNTNSILFEIAQINSKINKREEVVTNPKTQESSINAQELDLNTQNLSLETQQVYLDTQELNVNENKLKTQAIPLPSLDTQIKKSKDLIADLTPEEFEEFKQMIDYALNKKEFVYTNTASAEQENKKNYTEKFLNLLEQDFFRDSEIDNIYTQEEEKNNKNNFSVYAQERINNNDIYIDYYSEAPHGMQYIAKQNNASLTETYHLENSTIALQKYGLLTEADYLENFAIGDIPREYWNKVCRSVECFNGSWQVDLQRSDSLEDICTALGFSRLKKRLLGSHPSIADVVFNPSNHPNKPILTIVMHFPMTIVKTLTVKLDCNYVDTPDSHTGQWKTRGCFIDGRAIQRRDGSNGVMFDSRVIFDNDPEKKIPGKIMLFKWTFIPYNSSTVYISNRWLRKIEK